MFSQSPERLDDFSDEMIKRLQGQVSRFSSQVEDCRSLLEAFLIFIQFIDKSSSDRLLKLFTKLPKHFKITQNGEKLN